MSVLFVADQDFANMGYTLSECLRSVGVESTAMARNHNPRRVNNHRAITCGKEKMSEYS